MEEAEHLIDVIRGAEVGLIKKDATELRELSNQTIHRAATHQDEGCITLAVLIYALSKLIERRDYQKIANWDKFVKKICSFLDLAIKTLKEGNESRYKEYLEMSRRTLTSMSVNLRPYIQEVIRKAAINKASKIYEHGVSMGATAKMLGITQWELSEYAGQKQIPDNPYNETFDVKKRAQMALEFLS